MFRKKKTKGFYVDVGALHPRFLSNTWFFDVCLGWDGICIEANPYNAKSFKDPESIDPRSCKLIEMCVWDEKKTLKINNNYYMAKITEENEESSKLIEVQCDTLESILDQNNVKKVDFISIDIELAEDKLLNSTNLKKYEIDVVTIENKLNGVIRNELTENLVQLQGYSYVFQNGLDGIFLRNYEFVHKKNIGSDLPYEREVKNKPEQY